MSNAPIFLLLFLFVSGCAGSDGEPGGNDDWGLVTQRVDEQGFHWKERKSASLGLIARTAVRHEVRDDPASSPEVFLNVISTDEKFPKHIYNDWSYPNGTRQRELHALPPFKCYSIVSAAKVEYFSIEDRSTRKLIAVFVFDGQQRLVLDPTPDQLSAYDAARRYNGPTSKE